MKIAGIIAEYNPFHKGHAYHIKKTKEKTEADYIIVGMSGNFVQRGEPAIVDKYIRTRQALEGGADLVLEIPTVYATASAEYFATAGVKLFHQLGCVDVLSFGSEWADEKAILSLAGVLEQESEKYKIALRRRLGEGMNFPKAREGAINECFPETDYAEILKAPNHILSIEYGKALIRERSNIRPVVIQRKGSGYHAESWDNIKVDGFPSATSIRRRLSEYRKVLSETNGMEEAFYREVRDFLQEATGLDSEEFVQAFQQNNNMTWKDGIPYLDYRFIMEKLRVEDCFGANEDILQRLKNNFIPGIAIEERLERCHAKNLTDAALRRIFLHLLLRIEDKPYLKQAKEIPVPYARVLGFRKESSEVLRVIRETSSIPLIQKLAKGYQELKNDPEGMDLLETDLRSADFYEQIAALKSGRKFKNERIRNQIIL